MDPSRAREPSSFRDPSGFLFEHEGVLYRQVNACYGAAYERLLGSGLYDELTGKGLLIPHDEVAPVAVGVTEAVRVLRPERLPFIAYPYEWCFSQLKAAALATLEIQRRALDRGMSLKDASAYNIQFRDSRPVLIDTLSFEPYREGAPWVAYRQFCQHFLAPLALMAYATGGSNRLAQLHIDGVPLAAASALLPGRTRWRPSLLVHVHMHARSQVRYADRAARPVAGRPVSLLGLRGLVDSLDGAIRGLTWRHPGTEWGSYYDNLSYTDDSLADKQARVAEFLEETRPQMVWDLGANTGLFSRIASKRGVFTVAGDLDPVAVDRNYLECAKHGEANLLPLLLDATNPSPAIGWANEERRSLEQRGPADALLALALIHHLAIGNNLPLGHIASWLARLTRFLIIEFVPKDDVQVKRLLATRDDVFPDYHAGAFEAAFETHFTVRRRTSVRGSSRCLYLMERRAKPA